MIDSLKKFKNTSEYIDFRNSENRVLATDVFSKKNSQWSYTGCRERIKNYEKKNNSIKIN